MCAIDGIWKHGELLCDRRRFHRSNPSNGIHEFYGAYLIDAQGEDVVAGIRMPQPIVALKNNMPKVFEQLVSVCKTSEDHFRDMQDFEFTIEQEKLYMLQTRNRKRAGLAAVRIAVEMVDEKRISKEEAVQHIPADSISSLLVFVFDEKKLKKISHRVAGGNRFISPRKKVMVLEIANMSSGCCCDQR
jgi:pyruvate,orthophosphate dikinase